MYNMLMDKDEGVQELLQKAGLGRNQAKIYLFLIENGESTPTKIANELSEKRTTVYASCEKMTSIGILSKAEKGKAKYKAKHPAALELLAERRRKQMQKNEQILKTRIDELIGLFFKYSEEPGVKTAEGYEAIKDVYEDEIVEGKDIYILRTKSDQEIDKEWWDDYRERRAEKGINVYAITSYEERLKAWIASGEDERLLFHRTLIPNDNEYDGRVEIDVYGNKTALLIYGETQIAMTIINPLVAESFRWMLKTLIELFSKQN